MFKQFSKQLRLIFNKNLHPFHPLRPFYTFKKEQTLDQLLCKTDSLQQAIHERYPLANDDLLKTIQQKLRSLWTYHSNAIEGNTLSLNDTIFFLQEGLTVHGKPFKDFLDANNHAKAIDFLYGFIHSENDIDHYVVKYINNLLMTGVDSTPSMDQLGRRTSKPLKAGDYKTLPNHVLQLDGKIHRYVEPYLVFQEMSELFDWINKENNKEHPVIVSAIAHYNMVRIHPFDDGNGRGARILMNLILLRAQWAPSIIKVEDRKDYMNSLVKADEGDLNPFLCFIAKSLLWTQETILEELKKYDNKPTHHP